VSKASNVVQSQYILYNMTGFTKKWHSIPVATKCNFEIGSGAFPIEKEGGVASEQQSSSSSQRVNQMVVVGVLDWIRERRRVYW
jgi:hypothetical protein